MENEELVLTSDKYCYQVENTKVYHVGNSRIQIFSTLEGFITEETCFKLSKVETERILIPKPFYQEGKYVGVEIPWREEDWIYSFYDSGHFLKANLLAMKQEIELLTEMGIDLGSMKFYYTNYESRILTFSGGFRMKKSKLPKIKVAEKNNRSYEEYLNGLVYNGMSEFGADSEDVIKYLRSGENTSKKLEKVLGGRGSAGKQILTDIKRSR